MEGRVEGKGRLRVGVGVGRLERVREGEGREEGKIFRVGGMRMWYRMGVGGGSRGGGYGGR